MRCLIGVMVFCWPMFKSLIELAGLNSSSRPLWQLKLFENFKFVRVS